MAVQQGPDVNFYAIADVLAQLDDEITTIVASEF